MTELVVADEQRIDTALTMALSADVFAHAGPSHATAQMFILAAHLAGRGGELDEDGLAVELVASGWHHSDDSPPTGTQQVLAAIATGIGWWRAAPAHRGGRGTCGSDAAVRAIPVGLLPAIDLKVIAQLARRSAVVTHAHLDAVDAAAVQACAVALACSEPNPANIDAEKFLAVLSGQCRGKLMPRQLATVSGIVRDNVDPARGVHTLGHGTTAVAATSAAVAAFLIHPTRPADALTWAQTMGERWHASAIMAASLAGAANPHTRPPLTWSLAKPLRASVSTAAAALAVIPVLHGHRSLIPTR